MRRLGVLVAVMALAVSPIGVAGAQSVEPQTSLPDIEDEVMCTICGTLLEFSEAPQAERERALIRRLIDEGRTKGQIEDALVAEYGDEVLATPGDNGFDLAAWLVPGAAIVIASVAIFFALRRWRREGGGGDDGSAEPPGEALSEEESQRLDADLARYEL